MDILLLEPPEGDVIGRASYLGGPDCEFIIWNDGQVHFRVVNDEDRMWAGPNVATFRRIASVWNRYSSEVSKLSDFEAQMKLIGQMREEMTPIGAFPEDLPSNQESLWSVIVTEAESGIG